MPDGYETDTTRTSRGRETAQMPHISDAPHISPAMPGTEATLSSWRSRLSWAAILAGVVTALLTQLFLGLLGVAFGAGSLAPLSGTSAASISTGAGVWLALTSILSALAGGYAAARFAGAQTESNAGWHGLTTWGLTALLVSYFMSSAASEMAGGIGGAAQSGAAQIAAPGLTQVADPFSSIEQQLQSATAGNNTNALRDIAIAAIRTAVTSEGLRASEASERAAQALARIENIGVDDARKQVQNYEQQYRQALEQEKARAKQIADNAARAVSRAGFIGALSLLLGGLAGWLGGRMAAGEQSLGERLATASGRARR